MVFGNGILALHPNGMNTSSAFALNATAALMMNPTSFSPAMRMEMTRCLCATPATGSPPRDGGNFVR